LRYIHEAGILRPFVAGALLWGAVGICGLSLGDGGEPWRRVESAHYTVYAAPDAASPKRYVAVLERFCEMLSGELGLKPSGVPNRIQIRIFSHQAGLDAFARAVAPRFVGHRGFVRRNTLAIVERKHFEITVGLLLHEVTHRLLFAVVARPPVWFNEGLACYYGVYRVRFHEARVGELDRTYLVRFRRALRTNRFIRLKDLIAMKPAQFYRGGSGVETTADMESLAYAESWALVYFLKRSGKKPYRGAVDRYLERLKAGEDPVESFRAVCGPDIKKVEHDWLSYVRGL